jgi:hypothetical protein
VSCAPSSQRFDPIVRETQFERDLGLTGDDGDLHRASHFHGVPSYGENQTFLAQALGSKIKLRSAQKGSPAPLFGRHAYRYVELRSHNYGLDLTRITFDPVESG